MFVVKSILKLASDPTRTFSEPSELAEAANIILNTKPKERHIAPLSYSMNEDGFVVLTATYESEETFKQSYSDRQECRQTNQCGWNAITINPLSRETIV